MGEEALAAANNDEALELSELGCAFESGFSSTLGSSALVSDFTSVGFGGSPIDKNTF